MLGFHDGHQHSLSGLGIFIDPGSTQTERFFGMSLPDFAGRTGGETDPLVDQLLVPRFADAEGVHIADLHIRHHLRGRNDDGRNVLVGINAGGGKPIAEPKIVGATGKGHRDLHFFALRLLGLEGGFQR